MQHAEEVAGSRSSSTRIKTPIVTPAAPKFNDLSEQEEGGAKLHLLRNNRNKSKWSCRGSSVTMVTDGEHQRLRGVVGGVTGGGGGCQPISSQLCEQVGTINDLPSPEETGASGTSPGSNDGARSPQTSTNTNVLMSPSAKLSCGRFPDWNLKLFLNIRRRHVFKCFYNLFFKRYDKQKVSI